MKLRCKRGHDVRSAGRYKSGKCVACAKAHVWRNANRERNLANERARYHRQKVDPARRVRNAVRARVYEALHRGMTKSARTLDLLGCSIEQLWAHLESQFRAGMTRENYGQVWELDHVRPCASFDLSSPSQQRECFGWFNLQPLFKSENLAKSDSMPNGRRGRDVRRAA